jgi:glutathione S-transferase
MLKFHGLPFSAHTRKVIITALEKGLAYELEAVVPIAAPGSPGAPPPHWRDWSPLGKIPVLQHGNVVLADSTVIALYLERIQPERPIYPADPVAYARALFIEEYVDGDLAGHVLHGLLMQRVFAPRFLKREPDLALIDRSVNELIPARLAHLETQLVGEWFAGPFSMADIAVASILINYHYAGCELSRETYPKLHAHLQRALGRDSFRRAFEEEVPAARQLGGLDMTLFQRLGY